MTAEHNLRQVINRFGNAVLLTLGFVMVLKCFVMSKKMGAVEQRHTIINDDKTQLIIEELGAKMA